MKLGELSSVDIINTMHDVRMSLRIIEDNLVSVRLMCKRLAKGPDIPIRAVHDQVRDKIAKLRKHLPHNHALLYTVALNIERSLSELEAKL
jgi:hypothetical protein